MDTIRKTNQNEAMYKTGEVLFNKYCVEKLIGTGAFGEVYLVTQIPLNSYLAIKILRKNSAEIGSSVFSRYRERFLLEAKLGANIQHPNIIRVHDFEERDEVLALVMDYAGGGSLAQKMQHVSDANESISISEFLKIALDISEGVAELHRRGIIHRDLKPGNILLDSNGRAMICDLGVAQAKEALTTRTHTGENTPKHPGTPAYMSPEQDSNVNYLTPPSDVYSLGIVYFEILTGLNYKNLEPGTHVRSIRRGVPARIDRLINKMLMNDTKKRPWNGYAVSSELKRIISSPNSRNHLLNIGGVIGLALIILTIIFNNFFAQPKGSPPTDQPTITQNVKAIINTLTESPFPNDTLSGNLASLETASPTLKKTTLSPETATQAIPTLTMTPVSVKTTIKTDRAWLRKGPALNHPIIEELKQGDLVIVENRTQGDWFLVKTEEGNLGWLYIAWIVSDFQKDKIPLAQTTPTPLPPTETPKPSGGNGNPPPEQATTPPYP